MHHNIPQSKQQNRRSRRRRRKKMQLFLNFFMLVCILIVIFCIGILKNRENEAEAYIENFINRTGYVEDAGGSVQENSGEEAEEINNEPESFGGQTEDSDNKQDSDTSEWYLTLVNKWNPMPENTNIETVELTNGECVDKRIYPYLQEMFDDARAEGIYPIVRSGFRTRQEQEEIYDDRMKEYQGQGMSEKEAMEETQLWVAVPGTSEHELGLAVDINADKIHSEGAEVYTWLSENAYRYGFINRYPSDKTEVTGVANEPWHYRYVGVEAAAQIHEQGICLEEYLGRVER